MVVTGELHSLFPAAHAHRQLVGPTLCAGKELAEAASKALGTELQFEHISQ